MEKHLIVCDRCHKEVSPQDRVRLTHDANDEHPSYLAMNLASNMDLCAPCSTAFVKWMRSAHDKLLACAMKNKALNPSTENWYDRAEQDFHDAIDFYSWLKPLVSPGGVFHID